MLASKKNKEKRSLALKSSQSERQIPILYNVQPPAALPTVQTSPAPLHPSHCRSLLDDLAQAFFMFISELAALATCFISKVSFVGVLGLSGAALWTGLRHTIW